MARSSHTQEDTPIMIDVQGVTNAFGENVVHQNLDLQVHKGEIVGLVGGSGTGKSVLLNTILGLRFPQAGTIDVLGRRRGQLTADDKQALNNQIGVLFQGGALFSSLTVRENIMLPMREHSHMPTRLMRELADMKIHMVGLPPHAATLSPSELSGGMRKRAGLARALALDPQLLFLDEPTAGLDPVGAAAFDQLILDLREAMNLTVLMVTHDMDSLYTICDRIAVLLEKRIAINDSVENVESFDHDWIREYFQGPRARAVKVAQNKLKSKRGKA